MKVYVYDDDGMLVVEVMVDVIATSWWWRWCRLMTKMSVMVVVIVTDNSGNW